MISTLRNAGLVLCALLCLLLCWPPPLLRAEEAGGDDLIALVVELLGNEDKEMRALGFDQVRSAAPGLAATQQFAAQLAKLTPEAQVGLLSALADRGDPAAKPHLLRLLDDGAEEQTRVAAIRALGVLGRPPEDVSRLVMLLTRAAESERLAARQSLTRMPGAGVGQAIAGQLAQTAPLIRAQLIGILASRRALDTVPDLLSAAVDSDPEVRAAAMTALGEIADPQQLSGMVRGVLAAEEGPECTAAEKCVMFVCQRAAGDEQGAAPLIAAIAPLPAADRLTLLPTLGRVGGPAALSLVENAMSLPDPHTHEMGIRAVCLWPNASIAPLLMEVASRDPHPKHRSLALKALIRIAPLPDGRPASQRLQLLQTVMEMCQRDKDRNRVLQRASAIRTLETLRFVAPYMEQSLYAEQACETVVELAHHRNLREPNEAEFHRALDQVIATSKNATVVDRAHRYKRDETWVRPNGS